MGTWWRQSKAPVGGLGQEKGLGVVQEGAGMCWLAWGRAEGRCSPQHGQQPCRQDPCQSTGWGHVPKARAPGTPRRAGASGLPGCARGAHTAVGPAGKATPQGAPWHWAGALHPPPSSALAAPALTQAQCQGQLGTAALSLNCCSSVPLAAPAPPPAQRRLHCSGSPSVLGGALGSGPAQQAPRAHQHGAYEDTGLGQTNLSGHLPPGTQQVRGVPTAGWGAGVCQVQHRVLASSGAQG